MKEFLIGKKREFEAKLSASLSRFDTAPSPLGDACKYSLTSGGKRIRPIFSGLVAEMLSVDNTKIDCIALAIEYVHNYSLVHDDLPSMDNDTLRHAKPCTHVVYGEGMGVLVGDALLNSAAEILLDCDCIDNDYIKAIRYFMGQTGMYGMIGGQCIDLSSEGKDIDLVTVITMNRGKTAALFRAAVVSVAIACGECSAKIAALESYCNDLGLIFQIVDDILDVKSTVEEMGKTLGKDTKNAKSTYLAKVGMDRAVKDIEHLEKSAIKNLKIFGDAACDMIALTKYLSGRRN